MPTHVRGQHAQRRAFLCQFSERTALIAENDALLRLVHDVEIAADPLLHVQQSVDHPFPVELARATHLKVLFLDLLAHNEADQANEAASLAGSDRILKQGPHRRHNEIHEYFPVQANLRTAEITPRIYQALFHCRLPSRATIYGYHGWYPRINS